MRARETKTERPSRGLRYGLFVRFCVSLGLGLLCWLGRRNVCLGLRFHGEFALSWGFHRGFGCNFEGVRGLVKRLPFPWGFRTLAGGFL